jgi:ornithine cyclodeaminase/alanine dehydrogenase-like protein (mu-crystallin family)
MRAEDVRGDLASVVAGRVPRRTVDGEILVFDSTGIALEDAAAAQIVYDAALSAGLGVRVRLGG